jgi:hypothetical protein
MCSTFSPAFRLLVGVMNWVSSFCEASLAALASDRDHRAISILSRLHTDFFAKRLPHGVRLHSEIVVWRSLLCEHTHAHSHFFGSRCVGGTLATDLSAPLTNRRNLNPCSDLIEVQSFRLTEAGIGVALATYSAMHVHSLSIPHG